MPKSLDPGNPHYRKVFTSRTELALGWLAEFFLFFGLFLKKIFTNSPLWFDFCLNTSLRHGQWRRGLGEASDVAVTWRRRGQGLGAVDRDAELLPYSSWRLK